jgi:parallel beta-helix repeat protein
LPNVTSGIEVATASSNLIGGTGPGSGNLISGNTQSGIYLINNPVVSNVIEGNHIGLSASGTISLRNGQDGITINGAGFTTVLSNVLSGNGNCGVFITGAGATNNVLSGNMIGSDPTGAVALPNLTNGVTLDAVSNNLVGGNIISGNKQYGLLIYSNSVANTVFSNHIGLSLTGVVALPNGYGGIGLQGGWSNIIGPGNVLSGNSGSGLFIGAAGASNNTVTGNYIGTDAIGGKPAPNTVSGLYLQSSGNKVTGNVISGNSQNGVFIFSCSNNVLTGNLIGTDATGKNYLGNGFSGVACSNAPANIIGGPISPARNVISGNLNSAINLGGTATVHNVVQGNFIGTDITGTASIANRSGGIYLYGAGSNLLGGSIPGAGNVISGNNQEGISVGDPGANGNTIQGNFLGLQSDGMSPLGNQWHNIEFLNTASNNLVGGPTVWADNHIGFALTSQYDGVRIRPGCFGNFVERNCIFSNAGWGIVLNNAGVTVTNLVTITAATSTSTNGPVMVNTNSPGTNTGVPVLGPPFVPPASNATVITASMSTYARGAFYVQFYLNHSANSDGYGQGLTYLGATHLTTDGNGQATFTVTLPVAVPTGSYLSATATDAAGTTWEFGPDFNVLNGIQPHSTGTGTGPATGPAITMTMTPSIGNRNGTTTTPLTLTWPSSLTLQQTTNLTDPLSWQTVNDPSITTTGSTNILQTFSTQPQLFYRLVSTNATTRSVE